MILLLVFGVLSASYQWGTVEDVEFTITDVERITDGHGANITSKYLLYTKEGEVFENTDAMFHGKFNSSTFHGWSMEHRGQKVWAKVYGFRIPFMSMYRNIYDMGPMYDN